MLRVLFLIENQSFPFDNRVRREARALLQAGAQVSVISPSTRGYKPYQMLEGGVHAYFYPKPTLGSGFFSHLLEYAVGFFWHTLLTARVYWRHGFDVIHAANPPDHFWLVAAPYCLLWGRRYIFDHHDAVPELYEARFGRRLSVLGSVVLWMEKANFRLADRVICINESFRKIAIRRGGVKREYVTVVRNGPHLAVDFPKDRGAGDHGRDQYVVGYLGEMNPQDNVDLFLEMAHVIRSDRGRADVFFVMVGSGDSWTNLRHLRDRLGLAEAVEMTGRLPWGEVVRTLARTDVCVQPDLPTVFNQLCTHNKLMEYMAMGKASVAFDMEETRVSGGDGVLYVKTPTAGALADAVLGLIDNRASRLRLGQAARTRIDALLSWERQVDHLYDVYESLFPNDVRRPVTTLVKESE